MYIGITLNNQWISSTKISLLNIEVKKGSMLYNLTMTESEQTIAFLDRIAAS